MKHAIDLTRYHFMRELGDICLFGTWVYNDDQEDTEPCLVIVPRYRHPASVIPCVIALSAAHQYDDASYCVTSAHCISENLGFSPSMHLTHRIADMIYSHLPDLVSMPHDPTEAVAVAEGTLDYGNGIKKTVTMYDHIPIAQA